MIKNDKMMKQACLFYKLINFRDDNQFSHTCIYRYVVTTHICKINPLFYYT